MAADTKTSPSSSPSGAAGDRRRFSGQMFGNLQAYKRDGAAYETRRTSVAEMSAQKPGVLATAFNNVFKGPAQSSK
ncbi:hypothetical protein MBLNU457_3697t1 [Dothideomycetes sp. NU457]